MIEHKVEQGEEGWFHVKLGVLSASQMKDVFTSTGKASSASKNVVRRLATERVTGEPVPTFKNADMQRGNDFEKDAALAFSMKTCEELLEVGFFTTDDATLGASPDRLFSSTGVEIKCPRYNKHLEYFEAGKCPAEYYPQVQTTMYVMGMENYYFCSYFPKLPLFICEVPRDDDWIAGMLVAVGQLYKEVDKLEEMLNE